jgi:tRNA pseudouridine55 synthase
VARARRGDPIDGVLLLDKPSGITSNLALQKARRAMNAAKAGHTGTLDPLACGLLPLTFGEATKFSADLLDADKAYEATLSFGVTTTTGDADGEVVESRAAAVTHEALAGVLERFVGVIEQVPPMHSALKRDGQPLYKLARQGIEVERASRRVTIHRLELLECKAVSARISVDCSKGTYVRVLAQDIGAALGCGAHLAALRRTRVGALTLAGAVELAVLEAASMDERRARLLRVDALLDLLPRVDLDADAARLLLHGQPVRTGAAQAARVKVYGPAGLLGVGAVDQDGLLAPQRLVQAGEN